MVIYLPEAHHSLIQSLHWVQNNLSAFKPVHPLDGILPQKLKALSELSLTCLVCSWYEHPSWTDEIQPLVEFVEDVLSSYPLKSAIIRNPFLCNLLIPAYVCMEQCGMSCPESKILIQKLIDSGYVFSKEIAPHERMGRYFYLALSNYKVEAHSLISLYQETFLHRLSSLFHLQDSDVYAITHVLFYLSSFGCNDLLPLLGDELYRVSDLIELLLGLYVRQGNWDLTAELLICSHIIKTKVSPVVQCAWNGLLLAQHSDGYFMSKSYNLQAPELAESETAATYIFERNYHPTLVAIMALSLCHQHQQ